MSDLLNQLTIMYKQNESLCVALFSTALVCFLFAKKSFGGKFFQNSMSLNELADALFGASSYQEKSIEKAFGVLPTGTYLEGKISGQTIRLHKKLMEHAFFIEAFVCCDIKVSFSIRNKTLVHRLQEAIKDPALIGLQDVDTSLRDLYVHSTNALGALKLLGASSVKKYLSLLNSHRYFESLNLCSQEESMDFFHRHTITSGSSGILLVGSFLYSSKADSAEITAEWVTLIKELISIVDEFKQMRLNPSS